MGRAGRAPGQALVELVLVLPLFVALGVYLFALLTPALAPLFLRERLFLEVRGADGESCLAALAASHQEQLLPPYPRNDEWSSAVRESRPAELPLLLHRRVFPGITREVEGRLPLSPLLERTPLPGALDDTTGDECGLKLLLVREIPLLPSQVRGEVEAMFLGGALKGSGLLGLLRKIGIDPVRVDLDALPGEVP